MESTRQTARRERARDVFWNRHSNPWSGWTRLLVSPALLFAIYHRNWRLLAATVGFAVVNPVLFPEPTRTDDWMTRGVLAERYWFETGHDTFGLSFPTILNTLNVPVSLLAVYAAVRKRPLLTVVGTATAMGLKLWFVDELIAYREARVGDEEAY